MAGAADGVGVAVDAFLDAAIGAAKAAAIFLFYLVLAAVEGNMGGRAGGTIMTLIHSMPCGCPGLFLRWHGQSCPPCLLGQPLALQKKRGRGWAMEIEQNT